MSKQQQSIKLSNIKDNSQGFETPLTVVDCLMGIVFTGVMLAGIALTLFLIFGTERCF